MRSKMIFCVLLGWMLDWTVTTALAQPTRGAATSLPTAAFPAFDPNDPNDPNNPTPPQRVFQTPYVERRWIGLRRQGLADCPPVDGWSHASLLRDPAEASSAQRRAGLDRICVYSAVDLSKPFQPPAGLLAAERDRMAVAPLSVDRGSCSPDGALGLGIQGTLAEHFLQQIGQVKLRPSSRPGVRLVFVDTQPTGEGPPVVPGTSCHGYTMAHLAYQLVCGDGECGIDFATRLALRYDHYEPNLAIPPPRAAKSETGGHVGLVSDLALAILDEVERWERSGARQKLVLNLSVGWDSELPGTGEISSLDAWDVEKMEPSALAVYNALRYAARRGVLVIAAAGNRRGGQPVTSGPVLPAAWELHRPLYPFLLLGRKPVYGVSGVDWQGLPLSNTRRGGQFRRVAYGDHAIARTGPQLDGGPTSMHTGSSVSTAVTSAVAAALWSLRPDLGRGGVMRLLLRSADRLESPADFYAWKLLSPLIKAPRQRRITLCRTVLAACGRDGERCPALESIDCRLWRQGPASFKSVDLPVAPIPKPTPGGASPMDMLPDLLTPGWVGPQPPNDPCPTCSLVPVQPGHASLGGTTSEGPQSYALLTEVSSAWRSAATVEGVVITGAVLTVECCANGVCSPPMRFNLSAHSWMSSPAQKVQVGPIGGRPSLAGCKASVDFQTATTSGAPERSVQSSVYVDP